MARVRIRVTSGRCLSSLFTGLDRAFTDVEVDAPDYVLREAILGATMITQSHHETMGGTRSPSPSLEHDNFMYTPRLLQDDSLRPRLPYCA